VAPIALTNAFCYVDNHDFTGDSNALMLNVTAAQLEKTTFRSGGWKEFLAGLKDVKFDLKGLWQSATLDSADTDIFPDLGVSGLVNTVADTETETLPAYLWQEAKLSFQYFGKVGDVAPFSVSSAATNNLGIVRGQLAKAMGTVSATGALGSGLNLGAISATQKLYASFHIFGTPGTTVTVVIESATANTFAGATTRATIGPLTTAGGVWLTPVAGAQTDTWWRYRVSAITGTFTVAGALAVQ